MTSQTAIIIACLDIHDVIYCNKDDFHNGDRIKYSFVSLLTSLSNLAAMGKLQQNI